MLSSIQSDRVLSELHLWRERRRCSQSRTLSFSFSFSLLFLSSRSFAEEWGPAFLFLFFFWTASSVLFSFSASLFVLRRFAGDFYWRQKREIAFSSSISRPLCVNLYIYLHTCLFVYRSISRLSVYRIYLSVCVLVSVYLFLSLFLAYFRLKLRSILLSLSSSFYLFPSFSLCSSIFFFV